MELWRQRKTERQGLTQDREINRKDCYFSGVCLTRLVSTATPWVQWWALWPCRPSRGDRPEVRQHWSERKRWRGDKRATEKLKWQRERKRERRMRKKTIRHKFGPTVVYDACLFCFFYVTCYILHIHISVCARFSRSDCKLLNTEVRKLQIKMDRLMRVTECYSHVSRWHIHVKCINR